MIMIPGCLTFCGREHDVGAKLPPAGPPVLSQVSKLLRVVRAVLFQDSTGRRQVRCDRNSRPCPAGMTTNCPARVPAQCGLSRGYQRLRGKTMTATEEAESAPQSLHAEQVGYKQSLNRRHVQMIAIGGAIGTGLFLGSASRLHSTGPALLLSYAFVGVIAYFLMRALGELVLHRPTSGAFVSYMRE